MRIAFIQPWLPRYREELFRTLIQSGAAIGHEIEVFHGSPPPDMVARQDAIVADFSVPLPTKFIKVAGRFLNVKDLSLVKRRGPWDLIVVEQAIHNLETFSLVFRPASRKLAFWGHGKTYTEKVSEFQDVLKAWLTNRADWFFSYTASGREAVISRGFAEARISVTNNSTDVDSLRQKLQAISPPEIEAFQSELGLTTKTALFIGALDKPKRLKLLLESSIFSHQIDPDFRLLIAGRGEEESRVSTFCDSHPWVVHLGRVDGREKTLALRSSQVLAIPGRLGLAIVDGFAAGLPTVTTSDPNHPPEFDYLENEVNGLVVPGSAETYGSVLVGLLRDPVRLKSLQAGARIRAESLGLRPMSEAFMLGFEALALEL